MDYNYITSPGKVKAGELLVVPSGVRVGLLVLPGTALDVSPDLVLPGLEFIEHMTWYCEYDIMPNIDFGNTDLRASILRGPPTVLVFGTVTGFTADHVPSRSKHFSRYMRAISRDVPGLPAHPYEILVTPRFSENDRVVDPVYLLHPQLCPRTFVDLVTGAARPQGCTVLWVHGVRYWVVSGPAPAPATVARSTGRRSMTHVPGPAAIEPSALSAPTASDAGGYGLLVDNEALASETGASPDGGIVMVMKKIKIRGGTAYTPVWDARTYEPVRRGGLAIPDAKAAADRGEVYVLPVPGKTPLTLAELAKRGLGGVRLPARKPSEKPSRKPSRKPSQKPSRKPSVESVKPEPLNVPSPRQPHGKPHRKPSVESDESDESDESVDEEELEPLIKPSPGYHLPGSRESEKPKPKPKSKSKSKSKDSATLVIRRPDGFRASPLANMNIGDKTRKAMEVIRRRADDRARARAEKKRDLDESRKILKDGAGRIQAIKDRARERTEARAQNRTNVGESLKILKDSAGRMQAIKDRARKRADARAQNRKNLGESHTVLKTGAKKIQEIRDRARKRIQDHARARAQARAEKKRREEEEEAELRKQMSELRGNAQKLREFAGVNQFGEVSDLESLARRMASRPVPRRRPSLM